MAAGPHRAAMRSGMVLRTLARASPVKHRLKIVILSLKINYINNKTQRTPIVSRTAVGRVKLG